MHGANRLGTNSLVDLIVFGRRAGKHIASKWLPNELDFAPLPADPEAYAREMVESLLALAAATEATGETQERIREELRDEMMDEVGVVRDEASLTAMQREDRRTARSAMERRASEGHDAHLQHRVDGGDRAGLLAGLRRSDGGWRVGARREPGGHFRDDFPKRDDVNFLPHTLAYRGEHGRRSKTCATSRSSSPSSSRKSANIRASCAWADDTRDGHLMARVQRSVRTVPVRIKRFQS